MRGRVLGESCLGSGNRGGMIPAVGGVWPGVGRGSWASAWGFSGEGRFGGGQENKGSVTVR
jgi:hypothetical protein